MNPFDEFQLLIKDLNDKQIKYSLIGGVAMAFHDEPRFTQDIDILLAPEDLDPFKAIIKIYGYFESTKPCTFQNIDITLHRFIKIVKDDTMIIDILVPVPDISDKIIKNSVIAESEYGTVQVASKKDLIWLKSFRNSKQDQADIERLYDDKN